MMMCHKTPGKTPKLRETAARTASHAGHKHQASELKGQKGPSYSHVESETKAAEQLATL